MPSAPSLTGPRALNLRRDLKQVAQIISEAFGAEMDEAGLAALRDLRMAAAIGPILDFLLPPGARPKDTLAGFVWEQAGQVVGNVTVQPDSRFPERFLIANVAVLEAWRGRGIASALMQTALAHIAAEGGQWAMLQVRASNDLARGMYQRMGFEDVMEEHRLRMETPRQLPTSSLPSGLDLRPLDSSDWHAVRYLINRAMPADARWWAPDRARAFREGSSPGWQRALTRWLGVGHKRRWGLFDAEELVGVLDVDVLANYNHHIDLLLHPDLRPTWSQPLLLHALHYLNRYPQRPILARLHDYQPHAIQALLDAGFERTLTLVNMRRRILPKTNARAGKHRALKFE